MQLIWRNFYCLAVLYNAVFLQEGPIYVRGVNEINSILTPNCAREEAEANFLPKVSDSLIEECILYLLLYNKLS